MRPLLRLFERRIENREVTKVFLITATLFRAFGVEAR